MEIVVSTGLLPSVVFFFICIVVNCDYYFNNVLVDNRE